MEYPRMMVRPGSQWELETGRYDLRTVADADERDAALAEGWFLSQEDAVEAAKKPAEPDDDKPPTRDELEQKAIELGIKLDGRWSDAKLSAKIAEKLAEA